MHLSGNPGILLNAEWHSVSSDVPESSQTQTTITTATNLFIIMLKLLLKIFRASAIQLDVVFESAFQASAFNFDLEENKNEQLFWLF